MEVGGQLHAPTTSIPFYPLDRSMGGPQCWSGCYGEETNLAPATNHTLTMAADLFNYPTYISQ